MNNLHCISFSGGRTSAYMTIALLQTFPHLATAPVIFANTGKENEGTLKFVHQVDEYLGGNRVTWLEYRTKGKFTVVNYETASREGEPFEQLITAKQWCPNRMARFCTQDLKIRPMKRYLQSLGWKHWTNYVGIRYDEPRRWAGAESTARNEVFSIYHPLRHWGTTKADVLAYWKHMPFDLEIAEHEGNCDVCFLKGKKKKQAIARSAPEKFDWWIKQEERMGSRFVNEYSYRSLRDFVQRSPQFDFDADDTPCFCTA